MPVGEKKRNYFVKMNELLDNHSKLIFVNVDNVESQQMHKIRRGLRGKAEILMGKNTLMRKCITDRAQRDGAKEIDKILLQKICAERMLVGNLGIIFTNEKYSVVTDVIKTNRIQAPARVGAISPMDVVIPATNTGLEPGATSFFQALNIATKIVKGTVEIINEKQVLKKGDKVDSSTAALLGKLNIKPFFYGLEIKFICDAGSFFGPEVLELTDEYFATTAQRAITNIAALSLAIGYPTQASLPHEVMNAFKELLCVSIGTNFEFSEFNGAEIRKAVKEGRSLGGSASPKKSAASPKKSAASPKKKAPEPEPEEDDVGMGGLFD